MTTKLTASLTPQELVEAVRAHSEQNYNRNSWSHVFECWSDEDIICSIGGATTIRGAIRKVSQSASATVL